jgi:hypothetical protein
VVEVAATVWRTTGSTTVVYLVVLAVSMFLASERMRGKPFHLRTTSVAPLGIMPFPKVMLSFLGGELLLGSSGLCFGAFVRVLLSFSPVSLLFVAV